MRLRLQELQEVNRKAQELKQQTANGYKEIDDIFHYQSLPFVCKAIQVELISLHYDNPLASHFGIEKTYEFLAQKYYWPTFRHDVEAYVKGSDICLISKIVHHKLYNNLQLLSLPTYQ